MHSRATWRVLIADDEPAARRGVRQLLAAFPQFVVIGEARNGDEALTAIGSAAPDVVFLDVQMPEVDGFEVVRRLTPARMPAVVFLTAYDQFAIRAFDAEAMDYLVKPVSAARFASTIDRLTRRLRDATSSREQTLIVSTAGGAVVLPLREIDWIEAADNYARVWVAGKSYLLRESLGDLEVRVAAHGFARAHRRALVRLDGVKVVTTSERGDVAALLSCGVKIRISRRRRASFSAALRALSR